MDPTGYLHLNNGPQDIRPSKIGIYARYDRKSSQMICVDFQDGRLHELADVPYNRLMELINHERKSQGQIDPANIHAAFLSISARWWTRVVSKLKVQLIHYQTRLLDENLGNPEVLTLDAESIGRHMASKKALHAIMMHLQRYETELETTGHIVLGLQRSAEVIQDMRLGGPVALQNPTESFNKYLSPLAEQFSALKACVQELQKAVPSILELSSDVLKWKSDMLLVKNGRSVTKLLKSARAQAKSSEIIMRESHLMTKEMRKDSISMKTVALLTMAFLPATSFAVSRDLDLNQT
ncbi:hypothetical protein N7451_000623 [Penicillium sp. IBT 35674x]|nr:hypothetical protein N7451_000623 [Penicillium sp. IBT 35674x]